MPEIKIGTAKQTAVKQMLLGLTPLSYKALNAHMSMMQGESWSNIISHFHIEGVFFSFSCNIIACAQKLKVTVVQESYCAFSDAVLGWKFLWPYSPPAEGQVPSEAEEIARRSAANATKHVRSDRLTCQGFITHHCILW